MAIYVDPKVRRMKQMGFLFGIFVVFLIGYVTISSLSQHHVSGLKQNIHRVNRPAMNDKTPHRYDFIMENPAICGYEDAWHKEEVVHLFIAIVSNPQHFELRSQIRETYASIKEYRRRKISYAFFIGAPVNNEMQYKLYNESGDYSDMLEEDFIDHGRHRDNSMKTMMAVKWIGKKCYRAKKVLKVTDEVMVNIFHLMDQMLDHLVVPDFVGDRWMWCDLKDRGEIPDRNEGSNAYASLDEYPDKVYPSYCSRGLFLTTPSVLQDLYTAYINTTYFWISSIHITGTLPLKVQDPIKFIPFSKSVGISKSAGEVSVKDTAFFYRDHVGDKFYGTNTSSLKLWDSIRDAHGKLGGRSDRENQNLDVL